MAATFSVFLIVLGAVLTWAVTGSVAGISLTGIGVTLLLIGVAGLAYTWLIAREPERGSLHRPRHPA